MQKDTHITEVMFRVDTLKDFKGNVFALFPHICETNNGAVMLYQHVGQHGAGDYAHCLRTSRPANELESADLKAELENHFGYNLKVIKKQNRAKFLKSYYKR